jgi:hypothetical protein
MPRERDKMKIEIDLKEVLTEEFGDNENLASIIKDGIMQVLTKELSKGIKDRVNEEVSKLMSDEIKKVVSERMPALLNDLIDTEYTIVDQWGEPKGKTTLRHALLTSLTSAMVYKAERYDSDKNFFSKRIDEIVAIKCDAFKKEFDTKVSDLFIKEAFEYAINKLRSVLGK